jgi:hypothetical protein
MNCNHYHNLIYLKAELSEQDLLSLQQHLATCTSCAQLAKEVDLFRERINRMASQEVKPANAAALTSSIMAAVHAQKSVTTLHNQVKVWIQGNLLRYSLATASLIQIIFFGIEFQNTMNHATRLDFPQSKAEVILDSEMIHYNPAERKQNTSGFAACKTPFIERLAYLECLKSKYSSTL